jgi:Tol biopolymer transport system component
MRLGDGPAKLRFTCSAQLIGRLGDNSGYKKLADQQNRYSEGGQLSPDDQQLAFESMRSGNPEIWKSNADGRNPLQLTFGKDENWAGTPRWSPDGKWIAFDYRPGSYSQICLMDSEGRNQHCDRIRKLRK